MKRGIIFSILIILLGCKVEPKKTNEKLVIVCSTSIIRDCIQEIVGDSISVESLMGPGIDPHSYNPRPSDIELLNKGNVIIYNGLHLEGKMAEQFESLKKRKTVYAVSDGIPSDKLLVTDASSQTIDPHIWFDTEIWLDGLKKIVDQLIIEYPAYKITFQSNFKAFQTKTQKQKKELRQILAQIPQKQRVLITSHDAFHYFGRSMGVEVKALQGISTTQEPGVQDAVNLVDFIVKRDIKSVFVEHSVSPKALKTIVESCKQKGHAIQVGGTLYSDALGDASSSGGTYMTMLSSNVNSIVKGLNGSN